MSTELMLALFLVAIALIFFIVLAAIRWQTTTSVSFRSLRRASFWSGLVMVILVFLTMNGFQDPGRWPGILCVVSVLLIGGIVFFLTLGLRKGRVENESKGIG